MKSTIMNSKNVPAVPPAATMEFSVREETNSAREIIQLPRSNVPKKLVKIVPVSGVLKISIIKT